MSGGWEWLDCSRTGHRWDAFSYTLSLVIHYCFNYFFKYCFYCICSWGRAISYFLLMFILMFLNYSFQRYNIIVRLDFLKICKTSFLKTLFVHGYAINSVPFSTRLAKGEMLPHILKPCRNQSSWPEGVVVKCFWPF